MTLFDHLRKFPTNPYLFIGSGISRRYIDLPTWEALLIDFFEKSGIKGEFEYYQSKCDSNLPLLASFLAQEFHEVWWKEARYQKDRSAFKQLAKEGIEMPFKIEIAKLIANNTLALKKYENEVQLFKKCVVDGIITTNWDTFIQDHFIEYKVFVGQQELLFSESISVGEIYKIHGCVTQPQTLVVTEGDYTNFNKRNAYLAAKLLTIFVEHPIIFLGYSLNDPNILEIINSIVKCVEPKNLNKLKDRLIFVEWKPGHEFEIFDGSLMLPEKNVLPIKHIKTDSYEQIFEDLSSLKRQIPVKILRKLKDSIVELVKNNKPRAKVYVKDIESITDDTDIEYAIGVGVASQLISNQGYIAIETNDLIEDILQDNRRFDLTQLIDNTFPRLTKGNAYIPIYKYLRNAGFLTKTGTLSSSGSGKIKGKFHLKANPPKCFLPTDKYTLNKQSDIRRDYKDISVLIKNVDKVHALSFIPLLDIKSIDLGYLAKFLRSCYQDETLRKHTAFRKLVCFYDFVKYGMQLEESE